MLFLKDTTTPRVSDGNISDEEDTYLENNDVYEASNNIIDHFENDESLTEIQNSSNAIIENFIFTPVTESNISQNIPSTTATKRSSGSVHSQLRTKKKKNKMTLISKIY